MNSQSNNSGQLRKQIEINLSQSHGLKLTKEQMIRNRKIAAKLSKPVYYDEIYKGA